jgi:hypothetical protein
MEVALGHFLTLSSPGSLTELKFQNFFVGETVDGRGFLPFGFSGTTTNRQGDNLEATLVFPNNELSRSWATDAIDNAWFAEVQIYTIASDGSNQRTLLYEYFGQVASGGWDETSLNLKLSTVLDAVGSNVPIRVMHRDLVGKLPTSSNLGL